VSRVLIALAAIALVSCGGQKTSQDPKGSGIMGGTVVPDGAPIASSIVVIFDKELNAVCTGSIIAENFIVTAAHCVNDAKFLKVVFGNDMDLYLNAHEQDVLEMHVRQVTAVVAHPDYSDKANEMKNTDHNDIAVMRFSGPLPPGYKPAVILADSSYLKIGLMAKVAGFGVDDIELKPVNTKKIKDLREKIDSGEIYCEDEQEKHCFEVEATGEGILRQAEAPIALKGISEVLLNETKGQGTCMGDSGGPAYLQDGDNYYLFGVTSRGSQLCDGTGIYTNVVYFTNWINNTMAALRKK
jgi:secreted trypsin-like serine protease